MQSWITSAGANRNAGSIEGSLPNTWLSAGPLHYKMPWQNLFSDSTENDLAFFAEAGMRPMWLEFIEEFHGASLATLMERDYFDAVAVAPGRLPDPLDVSGSL